MYVIDHQGGFYRFERTTEADKATWPSPTRLSETGLFASVAEHVPHPAALPFKSPPRSRPMARDGAFR